MKKPTWARRGRWLGRLGSRATFLSLVSMARPGRDKIVRQVGSSARARSNERGAQLAPLERRCDAIALFLSLGVGSPQVTVVTCGSIDLHAPSAEGSLLNACVPGWYADHFSVEARESLDGQASAWSRPPISPSRCHRRLALHRSQPSLEVLRQRGCRAGNLEVGSLL